MEWHKIQKLIRNTFGHAIIHPLVIFCTIWISGAIVAFITNETRTLNIDLVAIDIAYKWAYWLVSVWSQLTLQAYNYSKIKLILALTMPTIIVVIFYWKNFKRIKSVQFFTQPEKVYGDASWATEDDISRAGLRTKHGMLLGTNSGGYFVAEGFQHALLFAPTGSGKGVGFVIPN